MQVQVLNELKEVFKHERALIDNVPVDKDPVRVCLKIKGTPIASLFIQKRGSVEDLCDGECNPINKSSWNCADQPPLPGLYFHQSGCSHKYRCCTMTVLADGSYWRDATKTCALQWWQFKDDPEKEKQGTCPRFMRHPWEREPKHTIKCA